MYDGEIPANLVRATIVHVPIIPNYVTARLTPQFTLPNNTGTGSPTPQATFVLLENEDLFPASDGVKAGNITVQLQQTNDKSINGIRTNLGSQVTLVPGGQTSFVIYPTNSYLEIAGVSSSGTGNIKATFSSQIRWNILGFSKVDPFYPTQILVEPDPPISPLPSPSTW